MHTLMQHIRFDDCGSVDAIRNQLQHMVNCELLSAQEAQLVDCSKVAKFFETELGQHLRSAKQVVREFKFSILEDASRYYPAVDGEQVLLQGVVDCFVVEEDGLTVLDFKTDYVTQDTLSALVEKYKPQVMAYADALQRIYQKPVKRASLYFFSVDQIVDL